LKCGAWPNWLRWWRPAQKAPTALTEVADLPNDWR
jgi:hypothetical protein